jgi:cytochrome c553
MVCHGKKAEGYGPIPRLAGQHPACIAHQLEVFPSRARTNEEYVLAGGYIMHEVSKGLTAHCLSGDEVRKPQIDRSC